MAGQSAATNTGVNSSTATSNGGVDPVSAIANAVGQVFDFLKTNVNLAAKGYYGRLGQANTDYKDNLGQYKQADITMWGAIIIIALVFGIVGVILFIINSNKKKSK